MVTATHRALGVSVMALLLTLSPLVEAKRVGGGRSSGMSRSPSSYQSSPPPARYQPAPAAPTQANNRRFGTGALVAGAAAGAMAGYAMGASNNHNGQYNSGGYQDPNWNNGSNYPANTTVQNNGSGMSWMWLLLLGGLGFFLWRRFKSKAAMPAVAGGSVASAGMPLSRTAAQSTGGLSLTKDATPLAGGAYVGGQTLSDGSDQAAFLRQARATFNHVQAMNHGSQVAELQRYFTPQLYAQIQAELASNTEVAEFPSLSANLLDNQIEQNQHVASVRFTGTVSESLGAPAVPFAEVWHFVKPVQGGDWQVAGIQQEA